MNRPEQPIPHEPYEVVNLKPKDWDWCDTLPPALKETIRMLKEEHLRRAKRDMELDELLNRLK